MHQPTDGLVDLVDEPARPAPQAFDDPVDDDEVDPDEQITVKWTALLEFEHTQTRREWADDLGIEPEDVDRDAFDGDTQALIDLEGGETDGVFYGTYREIESVK